MNLDKQRQLIMNGWVRTCLDLEYVGTENEIRKLVDERGLAKIRRAMLKPVMLGEISQRILNLYEEHFSTIITGHGGFYIEC